MSYIRQKKYRKYLLVKYLSIFLVILLSSCAKEKTVNQIPKVFLKGNKEALTTFYKSYKDSLSESTKNLFLYYLGENTDKEILTRKNRDLQVLTALKWGVKSPRFEYRFKSAVFFLVNFPFLSLPKANSPIEAGLYSASDSVMYFAQHLVAHYPPGQTYLVSQKLENLIEQKNVKVPYDIFVLLSEKFHFMDAVEQVEKNDQSYPGVYIDTVFTSKNPDLDKIFSWPDLYTWDWLTSKDSLYITRLNLDSIFVHSQTDDKLIIWKCFQFNNIDPIARFDTHLDLDTLYRHAPIHMKSTILKNLLSKNYIQVKFPLISSWLADTTLSDVEHRRIIANFPDDPPAIYFQTFYDLLDNPFLQKKALKLITAMHSDEIDQLLLTKLQEKDPDELPKVIYVSGFRRIHAALPLLENFKKDPNDIIRFNSKEAIRRINESKIP